MTRTEERRQSGGMAQFTASAEAAAADVVRSYSTSFGLATRLLGRRHRRHIRNVYALVRIADEIVDGVGSEAGFDAPAQQREEITARLAQLHRQFPRISEKHKEELIDSREKFRAMLDTVRGRHEEFEATGRVSPAAAPGHDGREHGSPEREPAGREPSGRATSAAGTEEHGAGSRGSTSAG